MNRTPGPSFGGIDTVIFDFDGVVAEPGFSLALQATAAAAGQTIADLRRHGMVALLKSGYVLGSGSEAAFWRELARRTGLVGKLADFRRHLLAQSIPRTWMLKRVGDLAALGYRTALLTDHTDWLDQIDRAHPFSHCFQHVFNSYRLGQCKADEAIFDRVCAELGVTPGQALFIDDNPDNVARARRRGLTALVYLDRSGFERQIGALLGTTPALKE